MLGIQIYFGGGTPAPAAVEWDRFMLIVDGSESTTVTESQTIIITEPGDLTDYGFGTDSRAYKSAAMFFLPDPAPEELYVYIYVSGGDTTYENYPLIKRTDTVWETPKKPPSWDGDKKVRFYGCEGGTGYAENYQNGSQGIGFTEYTDKEDNWTGQLRFLSGLSGTESIVTESNLTTDCKITASFTVGSEGSVADAIDQYAINGIAIALDNSSTKTDYTLGDIPFGDDQVDMMLKMRNMLAGQECLFFFALPGNADPDVAVDGSSTGATWSELKNSVVGPQENFVALKAKPSEDDDMAAGYMGMTATSHPHTTMSAAQPTMAIADPEPGIDRVKFADGQITTIMQRPELSGSPFLLTEGYTFGSGDFSRVHGTRTKYIIAQNLRNALWALIAERETYCSVAGCKKVRKRIEGVFNYLIAQGIVDGLDDIRIPMMEEFANNTEAAKLAASRNEIPGVEVDYIWNKSVETISITQVDNITT